MNITFAVEKLYEAGWVANFASDLEELPDGRPFPSVLAVQKEFAAVGLELTIKHNLIFNCYRASWSPASEPLEESFPADECHGTVIGACEREASVYALAQLLSTRHVNQMAMV